jgi:hypothetical protein
LLGFTVRGVLLPPGLPRKAIILFFFTIYLSTSKPLLVAGQWTPSHHSNNFLCNQTLLVLDEQLQHSGPAMTAYGSQEPINKKYILKLQQPILALLCNGGCAFMTSQHAY